MRAAADIAVIVLSPRWTTLLPDSARIARRAARAALASAPGLAASALAVALADDRRLRTLNRTFRGRDKPTNVLAFAGEPEPPPARRGKRIRRRHLGDVALALGTIAREAKEQAKPLADHLSHLVVHGVLHLLGHDHETDGEAAAMEALEAKILAGIGIEDPYRPRRPVGAGAGRDARVAAAGRP